MYTYLYWGPVEVLSTFVQEGDNKIHFKDRDYMPRIWNWTSICVNLAKMEGDLKLGWPTAGQACLLWTTPNKEATVLLLLYILAGIGQLSQGVPALSSHERIWQ